MKITLQLFGAFKSFGEELKLHLPENAIVSDIRKALIEKIKQIDNNIYKISLIDNSFFANQTEILSEKSSLQDGIVVAIIPPISGG
ncbi:hypothetical protein GUI12_01740 [Anaplasmataceae bacterium AB001_6]|nr:hypothetical protein GUI12_01740 [Anaplasmataceae bacterium AB001_6]